MTIHNHPFYGPHCDVVLQGGSFYRFCMNRIITPLGDAVVELIDALFDAYDNADRR